MMLYRFLALILGCFIMSVPLSGKAETHQGEETFVDLYGDKMQCVLMNKKRREHHIRCSVGHTDATTADIVDLEVSKPTIDTQHFQALYKRLSRDPDKVFITAARDTVSENTAYVFTKTMYESLEKYAPLAGVILPTPLDKKALLLPDTSIPLHPGALRFYKEIGLK